jgi:hypothetical protein
LALLRGQGEGAVTAVSVIIAVSLSVIIAEWFLQVSYQDPKYEGPIAYLDHSHVSLCDHEGYSKEDGDTYLVDNLVRNGFVPMAWKRFNRDVLQGSALVTSMAATRSFSESEIFVLDAFMKKGGHLMVLSGDRCAHASKEFFSLCGMEIETTPLGSVPADENSEGIVMYDANPIFLKEPKEGEVLCSAFGGKYPVVVRRNIGKGKLTAIADYGLFFNGRLERPDWANPPNIFFLRKLLKESDGVEQANDKILQ